MLNLKLYQAIEIPIPNGSTLTKYFFQDQPQLRNATINAIQVYTTNTLSSTPLTGSNMVSSADMKKSFLTLYSGDLQVVWNIPLLALNNVNNGTDAYVFELPNMQGIIISWVKSYVQLSSAPGTTGVAYAFGAYYTLPQ
jgi:hypothetical protein